MVLVRLSFPEFKVERHKNKNKILEKSLYLVDFVLNLKWLFEKQMFYYLDALNALTRFRLKTLQRI